MKTYTGRELDKLHEDAGLLESWLGSKSRAALVRQFGLICYPVATVFVDDRPTGDDQVVCSADDCDAAAVEVLVLRDQPGHVHDCSAHAAEVREWCDVVESYPMPCALGAACPTLYVAQPTPLDVGASA